jgi:peptidoglycan-associated lipoprotein
MAPLRGGFIALSLALSLLATACSDTASPTLSRVTEGVTDEPAPGYEQIRPGSEEEFIMLAGRRLYFSSGSAELDDVTRETLDIQAQWLRANPNWLVKLQGFADDPGGGSANVALSDRRAKAVMDYLAQRGVNPQRMWAKGYGIDRQVRDCNDLACKAQNRRVVVNLRTEFDEAAPQFRQARG